MSMTMTEGEVSSWMVKVGDEITDGDIVCEVMTDKVDMEVESPVSGTLVEIVVETGTVDVGEPIGWVEGEDDGGGFGDLLMAPETSPSQVEAPVPEPEPASADSGAGNARARARRARSGIVAAVPRARGLARERGVDLATVTGVRARRSGARRGRRGPGANRPSQPPSRPPSRPPLCSSPLHRRRRIAQGLPRSRATGAPRSGRSWPAR